MADETVLENESATEAEKEKILAQKTERLILLQSAATNLTKIFRSWWKQGNYIFDFSADGKHFRILVSDDKRPEKIHLESRSTGLQWFLSFFLVFLVERGDAHQNTILLLDEAGQSLHPLAQKDLISFFDSLAKDNQIIYTTHSPFLIDSNNVDQVRVVYIDSHGNSVVSSNLRASADQNIEQSVYAVHAALGLSVSDVLLHGCKPVIVEGPSDQFYLTFIKNYLISRNAISPEKDILFMPAGGVKGVESISGILAGKSEELPYIILDSDNAGLDYKNRLLKRLYKDSESKIICISDIVTIDEAEIEDLIPQDILKKHLLHMFKEAAGELYSFRFDTEKPFIVQVERLAEKHNVALQKGWKVDLARAFKQNGNYEIPRSFEDNWIKLFKRLNGDII